MLDKTHGPILHDGFCPSPNGLSLMPSLNKPLEATSYAPRPPHTAPGLSTLRNRRRLDAGKMCRAWIGRRALHDHLGSCSAASFLLVFLLHGVRAAVPSDLCLWRVYTASSLVLAGPRCVGCEP